MFATIVLISSVASVAGIERDGETVTESTAPLKLSTGLSSFSESEPEQVLLIVRIGVGGSPFSSSDSYRMN